MQQDVVWEQIAERAYERRQTLRREVRQVLAPLEATISEQQRTIDALKARILSLEERLAWQEHAAAS
jgi:uncharacterized coiled-coil protein SlyX